MVYGVSGSRVLRPGQEERLYAVLAELVNGRCFVTGSQVGVDERAAGFLLGCFPEAAHVQVIPGPPATHGTLSPETRWVSLPAMRDAASAYRARNEEVVRLSDALLAFPEGSEEDHPRSGTWMTVRLARKAGKPVKVYELGGAA